MFTYYSGEKPKGPSPSPKPVVGASGLVRENLEHVSPLLSSTQPEIFWGFPKLGVSVSGLYNKDYSIRGSILGSPYFGKLPF